MSIDKMRKGNQRRRVYGRWTEEEVAEIRREVRELADALRGCFE